MEMTNFWLAGVLCLSCTFWCCGSNNASGTSDLVTDMTQSKDGLGVDVSVADKVADASSTEDLGPSGPEGSQWLDLTGCEGFFGIPNEQTGLEEGLCRPVCQCENGEFGPEYDSQFVAELREWTLLNPPDELTEDPYAHPENYPRRDDQFCAVMVEDRTSKTYRLQTFDSLEEMTAAGGILTHSTACAKCSSLAGLALLIEMPDQTEPIRDCGMLGLGGDIQLVIECLEELGFERPCAQINAYNTRHTSEKCGSICMPLLKSPYQNPDGSLNACIQCDEDESGDIFRAVAGRARPELRYRRSVVQALPGHGIHPS